MDDLPIDDIRHVTGLLSPASLSRIEATQAEAVYELLSVLSSFWKSAALKTASLGDHYGFNLVPLFEKYAERLYDAYAEEMLPHFSDVDRYALHLAINVADEISNQIRPKTVVMFDLLSGDWRGAVEKLRQSNPEVRKRLQDELSEPQGDWEIYTGRTYWRHHSIIKAHGLLEGDPKSTSILAQFALLFQLKYQCHLRVLKNWLLFDVGLREHLSNRLAYWQSRAYRHAATGFEDQANSSVLNGGTEGLAPTANHAMDRVTTLRAIEQALDEKDRKRAVKLRSALDQCGVAEIWRDAFRSRRGTENTKRTAFSRWQAWRPYTPKWTDVLMRVRLLK